ncbi:hypothetical protein GVI15_15115 [Escherichia coli]|nr:hypothetical protein [Escherichia coli]
MKKIIFVSLISFSAIASYADTPYADEKEMSEDVSLLAQSSLLYKGRCEQVPDMRSSYSSGAHPRGTS